MILVRPVRLRSMRRARVVFLRLARGDCSLGPGHCSLRCSAGLWCWPACFPACPARDHRFCHRDDPAVRGGEEAPPAPEVKETSAIGAPTGGLLLPTPSGN